MPDLLTKEMTFTANRESLLMALANAAPAVPSRTPKTILLSYLVTVDPEMGTEVVATDLELGIRHRVLGVRADAATSVVLPAERLRSILAAADDADVTFGVEPDATTIRGARWKFRLPSQDPALFPAVPEFSGEDYHEVAAADLKRLVRRTAFATDAASTRYALGGCLAVPAPDSLAMVGTDGRQLAKQSAPATVGGAGLPAGLVLPVRGLRLAERTLDDGDPPARIAAHRVEGVADPRALLVRTGSATVYTRLVEGRFPRYENAFPETRVATCTVAAGVLLAACKQATITTSEESRGVAFAFGADSLSLETIAADVGEGRTEVAVAMDGPPVGVTLDARYLVDILAVLDRETTLRIELIDERNTVRIRTDDGLDYLVFPITRDR